jgi:hypothetical protein
VSASAMLVAMVMVQAGADLALHIVSVH